MTVTKRDLTEAVSNAIGPLITKRDVGIIINRFLKEITKNLSRGEKIELRGFGVFKTRMKKARTARNPKTGEAVNIPARIVPVFKPSKELKEIVKEE